ncbi:MAG: protein-glutamate O-methyltransferase CheR [Planctomycetaceae bacterium]|jgi:chemotaxis protein methyltransferase CheR|nr:protein-glutamate O-methyltransferase CheR [Planctomycetaceae bacterium]
MAFSTESGLEHITNVEFQALRDLIYERFGINLTEQKKGMVVGRLQKILRTRGFRSFHDYYLYLVEDKTNQAIGELANQITTNHTFFYRESEHFAYFMKTILPEITAEKEKQHSHDLRVWCAAASSGEEPYNIIMCMMEYFGSKYHSWDAGVLGTDISDKAMTAARKAIYEPYRLQTMPDNYKKKYFRRIGENWAVNDDVKKELTLRHFNLMNKTLPFKKPFDCIWCRNVMIYFDNDTKIELVKRLYDQTARGGYLLIGHSETIGRGTTRWKYICPAVYKKEE